MNKSELLLSSLTKFFEVPENKEQLHAILSRNGSAVSLRKLEWFVTNYETVLRLEGELDSRALEQALIGAIGASDPLQLDGLGVERQEVVAGCS